MSGMFVTLEGGEGAGKSTLIKAIASYIREIDSEAEVVTTREPGGGSIGAAVRNIVLSSEFDHLDPRAEALLFAADRAQHVAEVIRPALERGALVLCDRYIDSSIAYQGHARGLGAEEILRLSDWGTAGTHPHLTLVIDIDPNVGLARKHAQKETNRMEDLNINFHHAVRQAFLDQASTNEHRYHVINGHQGLDYVIADVLGIVGARWLNRDLDPNQIG